MSHPSPAVEAGAKVYYHADSFSWKTNTALFGTSIVAITCVAIGALSLLNIEPNILNALGTISTRTAHSLLIAGGIVLAGEAALLIILAVRHFNAKAKMDAFLKYDDKRQYHRQLSIIALDFNSLKPTEKYPKLFRKHKDELGDDEATPIFVVNQAEGKSNSVHLFLNEDKQVEYIERLNKNGFVGF